MVTGSPRHARRPGDDALTLAELLGRDPTSGSAPSGADDVESTAARSGDSAEWQRWRSAATRPNRRRLVLAAVAMATLAAAATVLVLVRTSSVSAAAPDARIALTTSRVQIGQSYLATAAGFAPGERVRFSWTGPTNGEMGTFPTDSGGNTAVPNPIVEKDPPGSYRIVATGIESGRVVSAPLQVLPPS